GAFLDHQNLPIALDNLGFDLARLIGVEHFERSLAIEDLLANLGDALRAQRISGTRPAEWRLRLFVALQQPLFGPGRNETRILFDLIELVENGPGRAGSYGKRLLCVFNRFVHARLTPSCASKVFSQITQQIIASARFRQNYGCALVKSIGNG